MTKEEYWYWLCNIDGVGYKLINQLLEVFHEPEVIFSLKEQDLSKQIRIEQRIIDKIQISKKKDWEMEYDKLLQRRIRFVTAWDSDYPERLKELKDKPAALYVRGEFPDPNRPTVAIIGARNCSCYGKTIAERIGEDLGQNQIQVISGMARGIDGAGQRGALASGGKSFAVLGSGVDICYPMEHWNLYNQLIDKGGVISEQPPGSKPLSWHFPLRNRIIAGLSDRIIVVEAKKKSGSLITVDYALEQGKDVYAVPGRIGDTLSEGCNELIHTGAGIVTNPAMLTEELFGSCNSCKNKVKKKIILAEKENMLYSDLDLEPKHIQIIMAETGLELPQVMEILLRLQLEGLAEETVKGYYALGKNSSHFEIQLKE